MDIRPAIRAALLADPAVVLLADERIFTLLAPQGERRPCIVFTRVSELEGATLAGPDGLVETRVQLDCWAETPDEASALAEAVRARVQGLAGVFGGVTLCGAWADRLREDQDRDTSLWRVSRDYLVRARAA